MNRVVIALAFSLPALAPLHAAKPTPDPAGFRETIEPLLAKYCTKCHGPEKSKGKIRLDQISPDLGAGGHAELWEDVYNQLSGGEMPPEDEAQPSAAERQALTGWINEALNQAANARRATGGKVVLRRLTRYEYNNTMRDLFGLDLNFAENLPPEPKSKDGFQNNGQTLGISPIQMEYYLRAARLALSKTIVSGPKPEVFETAVTKARDVKQIASGKGVPNAVNGRIYPGQAFRFKVLDYPREGMIRIRATVEADIPDGLDLPRLRVTVGHKADTQSPAAAMGEADLKAISGPQTFEFTGRIENYPLPGHNPKFPGIIIALSNAYDPAGVDAAELRKVAALQKRGKKKKKPRENTEATPAPEVELPRLSSIVVKSVEFVGPVLTSWPPVAHRAILFERPASLSEDDYASQVIQRFMDRAYRRPATPSDIEPVFAFYRSIRPKTPTFEEAIRESLAMVLISPEFLYLVEPAAPGNAPQPLSPHELATRLSYFLWSTMPDDALRHAADRGDLMQPAELEQQVARMIADERSNRFVRNFTSQWLGLSGLERVAVNPEYYPDFNNELKNHMRGETVAFVGEILRRDLSALTLLDSDFTMLNAPLARHYGLSGPRGLSFERVALQPGDHRGGLLTHASVLLINSTGEDSHPIRRAVWVRDRLLDDPPAPPPPDVPELKSEDPDFASLPLKRQLELHREKASCNDCHAQIDPWGIPFEHYDAVGQWREQVERVVKKGKKRNAVVRSPVVAEATLPGGHRIDGIEDLKRHLVTRQSQRYSRAIVRKLLAYSLGRSLELTDRSQVQSLLSEFEQNNYRLRGLIVSIAKSEPFRSK